MTCENCDTSWESRAFATLHRTDNGWIVRGYLVGGSPLPEVLIDISEDSEDAAATAFSEVGWYLGNEAERVDTIMDEEAA